MQGRKRLVAIKPLMSYIKARKGWYKKHKGTLYQVSCKQLGCPPNKEQTVLAANVWWERKEQELEAAEKARTNTPEKMATDRVNASLDGLNVEELRKLIE